MKPTAPHIILIISDDHGYADRSSLGIHPQVSTPALDRLASEGVEFAEAYVTAPVCSPSRAGLMAGQYQNRWGVQWFGSSRYGEHTSSIAEQLRDLGYTTGYLGKVHYGDEQVGDRGAPPHHGFQETFYGLAGRQNGRLNYLRHSRDAVEQYGEYAAERSAVQPMLDGDSEVELEGFLTDELGRRAREFVSAHAGDDNPFFLMVAFNAVHNFCWQLPPEELQRRGLPSHDDFTGGADEYMDWYEGSITPNLQHGREYYLAQLELMDAQIGLLLDHLDTTGQAENTIVVYLTDNGGSPCNYADNTPLAGTKYTVWEGGIRVPMLMRWPGRVPCGERRSGPVISLDLYPTFAKAAGAAVESYAHSDGEDLVAVAAGDSEGHAELHWDHGFQWAVRAGRYKLAWVDPDHHATATIRAVEHAEPGSGFRLFDLQADPGETTDLADQLPQLVAELTERHHRWAAQMAASAATLPPATPTAPMY